MGGLHGGGVEEAHDDAVGSGLDVGDGAICGEKMVGAPGIGYSGVDDMAQVVGMVATWLAIGSRGVWKLLVFSMFVFTNRFVCPPTPSGVEEVHLLLAAAYGIGDGGGFEDASETGVLVCAVESARSTVISIAGEVSLGVWRVLVGVAANGTSVDFDFAEELFDFGVAGPSNDGGDGFREGIYDGFNGRGAGGHDVDGVRWISMMIYGYGLALARYFVSMMILGVVRRDGDDAMYTTGSRRLFDWRL
jgi:hypothetical protein